MIRIGVINKLMRPHLEANNNEILSPNMEKYIALIAKNKEAFIKACNDEQQGIKPESKRKGRGRVTNL